MRELVTSVEFWLAMAFAIIMKLRASPRITVMGAILTTVTAVTCALIFTDPLMKYLGLDGETYTYAVSALIALTGEHLARQLMTFSVADALRIWLGGKK